MFARSAIRGRGQSEGEENAHQPNCEHQARTEDPDVDTSTRYGYWREKAHAGPTAAHNPRPRIFKVADENKIQFSQHGRCTCSAEPLIIIKRRCPVTTINARSVPKQTAKVINDGRFAVALPPAASAVVNGRESEQPKSPVITQEEEKETQTSQTQIIEASEDK